MGTSLREVLYESTKDLYESGLIEKERFERAEARYLSYNRRHKLIGTDELSPEEIKQLRLKDSLSEADLAVYLRTTIPTIKNWESGKEKPKSSDLLLLNIIKKKGLRAICA